MEASKLRLSFEQEAEEGLLAGGAGVQNTIEAQKMGSAGVSNNFETQGRDLEESAKRLERSANLGLRSRKLSDETSLEFSMRKASLFAP